MQVLHNLGEEHQSLAAVLHAVRFMLREISAGRLEADPALLQAMVHYLDAYAEKRHHPKEDLVFASLSRRTRHGAEALAKLAEQHVAAPQRIAVLQQALDAYVADRERFATLAEAFDAYAEFYRGHMMLEEEAVFPLLRTHLSAADWNELARAVRADAQSFADHGDEDFSALFSQLVAWAPAPIGLGPARRPPNSKMGPRDPDLQGDGTMRATPMTEAATSKFVRIDEGELSLQLHYNDIGNGAETVVMLHGSGPGASGWANFNRNIEPLVAAGYRVILMDCPGWSKSDPIVCAGSRSELNAKALKGLLDAIGVGKTHIVGNSMGGHSAVAFALSNPSRVGKLVLMGGGTGGPSQFVPMPTEGIKLLQGLYRDPTIENLKRMMSVFVFDTSALTDELFQARLDNMLSRREHLDNFVKSLAANPKQFTDYGPRLGEVAAPTLVIWGRDDRFVPLDVGLRLIWGMPNAELHVFNRCGHWAQWEHADKFNRMVVDFLQH